MLAEYTREKLAAGLDAVVMEILGDAGVAGPPVDALPSPGYWESLWRWTTASRAAPLCPLERAPPARLAPADDPGASDLRGERRQWAVAHEIGEHAAFRVFLRWGVDGRVVDPRSREEVANQLAGRLLLPTEWFTADAAATHWDLLALKARYSTASHELIARRMLECSPPVIVTIIDQGAVYFRRGNLPGRAPPLSTVEKDCPASRSPQRPARRSRAGPLAVRVGRSTKRNGSGRFCGRKSRSGRRRRSAWVAP